MFTPNNSLIDSVGGLPPVWSWIAIACALLAAVAWGVWRSRRRSRASQPACGHCGYFVTGLSGTVCPECGSDLRAVGVVAPGDVRHAPAPVRLAIVALLLPLPIVVGWRMVRPALPKQYHRVAALRLEQPVSGAYQRIQIDAFGWRWGVLGPDSIPITNIAVHITPQDRYFFIHVDDRPGSIGTVQPASGPAYRPTIVHRVDDVTADALLDWLARDAKLDRDDPRVAAEMRDLAELLQSGLTHGSFSPAAGPAWSSVSNRGGIGPGVTPPWILACWVGLWVLAGLIVVLRISRRLATPDAKTALASVQ